MKQRDQVQMTPAQAAEFLAAGRKVQLATNGHDGFPHLVTMYYAMIDGQITFWTYRRSQKAKNLERDPRISCLVETGEQYFDLRGVLVQGVAQRIEDPATIIEIGRLIASVLATPPSTAAPAQADLQPAPSAPAGPAQTDPQPAPPAPAGPAQADPQPAPPHPTDPTQADPLAEYVERAARKRYAYTVEPTRLISWDHTKLLTLPESS